MIVAKTYRFSILKFSYFYGWIVRDLWDIKIVQKCIVRHDSNEENVEVYVDEFDMDSVENKRDEATEEI